ILSDFVLRKQNARAPCAAPPVTLRSKWFVAIGAALCFLWDSCDNFSKSRYLLCVQAREI
ncbi:MAG: hypothetical protein IKC89_04000, partial [Lentisphaeria bacterium]|nr:hypothetical protein [Lentisphaeria bacterium]